ncbi:MAG TPA: AAA family ATPase [Spirochaetia bacterium]|nr:AAA family ATPase [Spirochaetia bacterium]
MSDIKTGRNLQSRPFAELSDEEFETLAQTERERMRAEREAIPTTGPFTPCSFYALQTADHPARTWYVDRMITPGLNFITAKMKIGKTAFALDLADAIAKGRTFLGRASLCAKVLYVSFELDALDIHLRLKSWEEPASENAAIIHEFSNGDKAIEETETLLRDFGYRVVFFDTFLPLLPSIGDFKINEYADTEFYRRWRLLGKKYNAAIVGLWHDGKAARDDFFLNPIGSSGMIGQADSLLSLDRKRGDTGGKLFIGGNHAPEETLRLNFRDGRWSLGEGPIEEQLLTIGEEAALKIIRQNPVGVTASRVGLELSKTDDAARKQLNRLLERGIIYKPKRGVYAVKPDKTDNSGQDRKCPKGQTDGTGHALYSASGTSETSGTHEEDDLEIY